MPLINLRGDVEQLAIWLISRQLADITPDVSEYGPAGRKPHPVVQVRRIPGAGGLDNELGVEQALLEVNVWAWDTTTVDGRDLALKVCSTAQAALLLAQRHARPTPFGSITRWEERTAPFENRNGTVPDHRTWMQAVSAVTVVPPLSVG